MSFTCLSFVNSAVLVIATSGVVVLVIVLGRRDYKMRENCELIKVALVVDVMAGATLVDLMAVKPVFQAI